jgi:protein TonB
MNKKIKIMNPAPKLSDEEIHQYMDFEKLLNQRTTLVANRKNIIKWSIVTSLLIVGLALLYPVVTKHEEPKAEITPMSIGNDTVVNETAQPADSTFRSHNSNSTFDTSQVNRETTVPLDARAPGNNTRRETPAKDKTGSIKKENVYTQAEPVDGYQHLYDYFNANLVYPAEALKDSIQGVLTISFTITPQGKPADIKIVQSLGEPFEQEATKLIQNMPLWKPATLNGELVASKISIPLTFNIQKVKR